MEILQTILNALSSENELIMNIISVPMTFIEIIIAFLLFTTILNINYSKKQAIAYILCFSLIAIISPYIIPAPFYTFINIVALPVLLYFILKTNALKALGAEILFYAIIFCIGTPLVILYSTILNKNSIVFSVVPIYKILYSLTLYIVLFILYKIIKKFNLKITLLDKFDFWSYNILIINFIIGTLAIFMQAYIECFYIDYLPISLIITSLVVMIIYFVISLYSLFRTNKLEETKQLLSAEKMYNKTLNTLHDNIRGFKHDFNNIIQAIGGYLSTNNIDGLKTYYKDLLEECQLNNNLSLLNPELINNPAIYSLLADKLYKCEKQEIKLNLEVLMDLSSLNIKMYELTRILGILLDNAIEAASKCDKKIVNIIFRKNKKNNTDLIIIQNTYMNKDVNIDRIFEKGYTSKQEEDNKSHGLGLWEVRKYLRKNTNLDLYTTKTDKYFSQQFEIYNF